MKGLVKLFRDQQGATLSEYALLVGLVAAALISIVGIFSNKIKGLFNSFNPPETP